MQPYKVDKNVVTTSGSIEEVVRVVEYRTAKGTVIGNTYLEIERNSEMDKVKLINDIIANEQTNFTEDDKEYLESQEVETLQKFVPKEKEAEAPVINEKKEPEKKSDDVQTNQPQKAPTVDEYVNNAPPEVGDYLRAGMNLQRAERKRLVNIITANEQNKFTEDQLNSMSFDMLQQVARLAAKKKEVDLPPNYAGNLDPEADTVTQNAGELPIPQPIMTAPVEKK